MFLENILEYATWGDELIGIRSRGKTARPLDVTSATQRAVIKWGLMFGVPALSIVGGLLVLWISKKRRTRFILSLSETPVKHSTAP